MSVERVDSLPSIELEPRSRELPVAGSERSFAEALRETDLFFHLLGYLVGRAAGSSVPVIDGLPASTTKDQLKAVSAAVANALHDAADHLPVYADFQVPAQLGAPALLAFGDVFVGYGAAPGSPCNTPGAPHGPTGPGRG